LPLKRHAVDEPTGRPAAGIEGETQDQRGELEVVFGVADARERRER
jgi:hypothetical protein